MTSKLPDQHTYYLNRLAPTPLVPVQLDPVGPAIWCKLEYLNPSGSTKDRIARYIIEKAWREGRLRAGDTVIEASSGSTSIAMALACAQLGLRFIAVMPEGVSNERVLIIRAYGGEIRLTPQADGIRGAIVETERLARPVNLSGGSDVECCSFSARIPGVVESVSTIFREDALPGLLTIEVEDEEAIATIRRLTQKGFPVGPCLRLRGWGIPRHAS